MKNIVLAASLAIAGFVATTAPASAQVDRHDYYGNYQGSTAPSNGGYDNRFPNGGGYGYNNYPYPVVPLACLIFCGRRPPLVCFDASGRMVAENRRHEMVLVADGEAARIVNTGTVVTQCNGNTFVATAQQGSASQPAAAPSFTRNGRNYYCRIENGGEVCRPGN